MIQILHNIQNVQEGKRHQKKDIKFLSFQICVVTNLSGPSCAFVFVTFVFGEKFPAAEF
jgi:hypothetical protein